ncbi:MAG TPA: alpha/beta fold hydrolase [Caulobacter sp.]|nr:alpha/beta fold hydrolase [Caulobacter sp.]
MSFITANGLDLWVERKGEGEPLLFISGSGGDLRNKPGPLDGPLARHFEMVAWDQRGLGQSDKPDGPYSMADYADDAAALLDELDWASANVVGVSFGGMVAQELAIRHPGRIRKLVLCCTSPGGEGGASYPLHTLIGMDPADQARKMIPISDTRHDAAWQADHPGAYQMMFDLRTSDPWAHEPRRAIGAELQLLARKDHDTWGRLPSIAAPTLVCGGRYDGIALPQTQQRMAGRIPGAQLRMFEGGHMFLIQDRAAFPAIIDFLQAP